MKKRKKQLGIFFLAAAMLFGALPVMASDYSDVAEGAWYQEAIRYVTERDLMRGTGNGLFEPDSTLDRAMLVTILHRLEGLPQASGNAAFTDVQNGSWYAAAVNWAAEQQIVSGVGNGQFAPNRALTQEEAITVLFRYAAMKGYDTADFGDYTGSLQEQKHSAFAEEAMLWAAATAVLQESDSWQNPQAAATRAQIAVILMRYINLETRLDSEASGAEADTAERLETSQSAAAEEIRIKITVDGQELFAALEDNATTQAILQKLPMTLPMLDLYGREMCYRFEDALPADDVQTRNFELGEIIYWPPRHSFVIMYQQDGEQFSMQHIGQIDSGVEIFSQTGDIEVTFERID